MEPQKLLTAMGLSDSKKRNLFLIGNITGCALATSLLTFGAFFNMFHTCPVLYGFSGCRWTIFIGCFIYFQVMANFLLTRFTYQRNDVAHWVAELNLPEETKNRFKLCAICGHGRPRRSYHCVSCNICVLRCDHHCMLTTVCIGIGNHGYFIVWVFWVFIGICYGSLFMYEYFNRFAVRSEIGICGYLFPIVMLRAFFGYENFATAIIIALLGLGMYLGLTAISLFCAQMFYVLKGYTLYEYHVFRDHPRKNMVGDGATPVQRLELVFGRPWYLSFIVPRLTRAPRLTPQIIANIFGEGDDDKEI